MITKNEIEEMLLNLPASVEKLHEVLRCAHNWADVVGRQMVDLKYHDEVVESAHKQIVVLEKNLFEARQAVLKEGVQWSAVIKDKDATNCRLREKLECLEAEVLRLHSLWHRAEESVNVISAAVTRDMCYYRDLVVSIGEMFGLAARVADDGGIADEVLVDKVPELVQKLIVQRTNDHLTDPDPCDTE